MHLICIVSFPAEECNCLRFTKQNLSIRKRRNFEQTGRRFLPKSEVDPSGITPFPLTTTHSKASRPVMTGQKGSN